MKKREVLEVVGDRLDTKRHNATKTSRPSPSDGRLQGSQPLSSNRSSRGTGTTNADGQIRPIRPRPDPMPMRTEKIRAPKAAETENAKTIAPISSEYDYLRKRLEELKCKYKSVEAKWNQQIEAKEGEREELIAHKVKEKEEKLKKIGESFCPQQSEEDMHDHLDGMKVQIEYLTNAGRNNEADYIMRQMNGVQRDIASNVKFAQLRELQARQAEVAKIYDREIKKLVEHIDIEIAKLEKGKERELKPIATEIKSIERRLQSSSGKVAIRTFSKK